VKVEVRKNKGYDFFGKEKIKIQGRTRFQERYSNRSPTTEPETLLGILMTANKSASARIPP
jgi:hypothetical protein